MRGFSRVMLAAAGVTLLAAVGPGSSASGSSPAVGATADPTVGPLYLGSVLGAAPRLGLPHYCTASVVHSPGRNLLLTAAHCVFGPGLGIEFVPGYDRGKAPYGAWDVMRVYVDRDWRKTQDPAHDFAFLQVINRVSHGRRLDIEDVVGANVLAAAPHSGQQVTVSGYVRGTKDAPVTCRAKVRYTAGYPTFDCVGFADGTSGGPWLTGGTHRSVVGLIGGLEQGGCTPATSYSPPFGDAIMALYDRAVAGGRGDIAPLALSGGC